MLYRNILKNHWIGPSGIQSYLGCSHITVQKTVSDKMKICGQVRFKSGFPLRYKAPPYFEEVIAIYHRVILSLKLNDSESEQRLVNELKEKLISEAKATGIPPVIRALIPSLYMVNDNYSYSGTLQCNSTLARFDEIEQEPPQLSENYEHTYFKLQARYDIVTKFCAREALLNLCHKTEKGSSVYALHDKYAVDEIFKVASAQAKMFSKKDLMKLVLFKFNLTDFQMACYQKVLFEFMIKIKENQFTVPELVEFTQLLEQVDVTKFTRSAKDQLKSLKQNMWDHISGRPSDIPIPMLAKMYSIAPTYHKKMYEGLNQLFIENINHMDVCNVVRFVTKILTHQYCERAVNYAEDWLELKFDVLTLTELETVLAMALESQYIIRALMRSIPIVLKVSLNDLSTELVVMILSYLLLGQHYDTTVLEIASNHYIKHKQGYSAEQLCCLLKAMGTFNFTPCEQQDFFDKLELYLMQNFYNIDVSTLLEMLVHLIYLDKVPYNFMRYVFAPLFLGLVNDLPRDERTRGIKNLRIMETAFSAQNLKPPLKIPVDSKLELVPEAATHKYMVFLFEKNLRGKSKFEIKPTPTLSSHYLEVKYSDLAEELGIKEEFGEHDKFAFLTLTDDSYSKNNKRHMLGHEMANIRLLQEMGIDVYMAPIDKLKELQKESKLENFFEKLLVLILDNAVKNLSGKPDEQHDVDVDTKSGQEDEVYDEISDVDDDFSF